MFVEILIASVIIILISFLLLGFNIFFMKKRFPETSVGHNRDMRKLGIYCVKCEEQKKYRQERSRFRLDAKKIRIAVE
jgi:hypothetical protein